MALKFRRGTTAQQSGSLAFGEPYVNTTLGTLVVGGQSGDIVLSTSGTGSTGNFGAISGSGLDITGNANIAGNVTVGGQLQIGDATADTVNVVASLSSSLIPQTTNAFDLGSATKIWRDLYISSGSIKMYDGTGTLVSTITATSLNSNTSSVNALNSFSASAKVQLSNLETKSASVDVSISNLNTTSASVNTSVASLNSFSASQLTQNSALATISGSLISTASNHEQRIAANEAVSSSYVRNNSTNTFNGNQTISGSLTVTQDLVVLGSSSIQNVSSSTLNIGTNLITVAVNQPAVRFGGIAVIDSGSSGGSGSFLYDGVQDEFIFVHKGNGTNVTSSHFLLGPETYDNLGNESYIAQHRVIKGVGNEHVAASNIFDDGTTISLGSNVTVTGSIVVSGNVDGVDISVFNSNVNSTTASLLIETANLETFSGSTLTRLTALESSASTALSTNNTQATSITNLNSTTASLNTSVSNLNSFTSSINTTIKSKLDADGVISSSAQLTTTFDSRYLNTGGDGVVSGSAQIDVASTTGDIALGTRTSGNYVATITAGTGVSSTGATTGEGIAHTISIGQAVSTTSNVQFGSIGVGTTASGVSGEIRATADITAYYSSDNRLKENIKPIENALDKVRKISGNTYDWKAGFEDIHSHKGEDVGVIAQEVEAVMPQLVTTREHGYKAVQYEKLAALLIEAIKEQQQHIDNLTLQVEELKKQKGL